jgi:hypothetical protein
MLFDTDLSLGDSSCLTQACHCCLTQTCHCYGRCSSLNKKLRVGQVPSACLTRTLLTFNSCCSLRASRVLHEDEAYHLHAACCNFASKSIPSCFHSYFGPVCILPFTRRSDMLWCMSVQAQGMAVLRSRQLAVWHDRQLPTPRCTAPGTTATSCSSSSSAFCPVGCFDAATTPASAGGPAAAVAAVKGDSNSVAFFSGLLGDIEGHSLYKALQDGLQQQQAAWATTHSGAYASKPSVKQVLQGLTPEQLLPLLNARRLQRATSFATAFR